jgi:hypothetical protein
MPAGSDSDGQQCVSYARDGSGELLCSWRYQHCWRGHDEVIGMWRPGRGRWGSSGRGGTRTSSIVRGIASRDSRRLTVTALKRPLNNTADAIDDYFFIAE